MGGMFCHFPVRVWVRVCILRVNSVLDLLHSFTFHTRASVNVLARLRQKPRSLPSRSSVRGIGQLCIVHDNYTC